MTQSVNLYSADATLTVVQERSDEKTHPLPSKNNAFEEEKEKTKIIANRLKNENTSPRLPESTSDSSERVDSSENEDELGGKPRSISCPTTPRNVQRTFPNDKLTASSHPVEKSTVRKEESNIQKKPRSLSMHALNSSSGMPALMKPETLRHKEFKAVMEDFYSIYNFFRTQPQNSYYHDVSQEMIEEMIETIQAVNHKMLLPIDQQLSIHGDYHKVTTQINDSFKNYCKHICDFYDKLRELHKMLNDHSLHIVSSEDEVDNKALCTEIFRYLAHDAHCIEVIKKFESGNFLKLQTENKALLIAIQQHIGYECLLVKSYLSVIGDAKLEKQEEKSSAKKTEAGQQKFTAFAALLQIPQILDHEKQLLEELYAHIKSRLKMRKKIPSYSERFAKETVGKWMEAIRRGQAKLEEFAEHQ